MGRLVEVVTRMMRMGVRALRVVLVDVPVASDLTVSGIVQGGGQSRCAV